MRALLGLVLSVAPSVGPASWPRRGARGSGDSGRVWVLFARRHG